MAAAAGEASSITDQPVVEARDRRRFPPPGHSADIGGRVLHLLTAERNCPPSSSSPRLPTTCCDASPESFVRVTIADGGDTVGALPHDRHSIMCARFADDGRAGSIFSISSMVSVAPLTCGNAVTDLLKMVSGLLEMFSVPLVIFST